MLLLTLLKNGNMVNLIRLYAKVGRIRCDYPCNIRLQLTFFFDYDLDCVDCCSSCVALVGDVSCRVSRIQQPAWSLKFRFIRLGRIVMILNGPRVKQKQAARRCSFER